MSSDHTGKCVYWYDSSDCPHPSHGNVIAPKVCRRCVEGNVPEWSDDARCFIHRDKRPDRTCDNPPAPPSLSAAKEEK